MTPAWNTEDLEEVRAGLQSRARDVAEALLGKPGRATSRELRYGRKGSLAVQLQGARRGFWYDHEAQAGGDLLALIQRVQGDFASALDWARGFLGLGGNRIPRPPVAKRRNSDRARDEAEAAEAAAKVARAARIWGEAVEIPDGSPADLYLRVARAIPKPAGGWPAVLRFHRSMRALVCAATTAAGSVQAVQVVRLTAAGEKAPRAEQGPPTKQTFGPQDGAVLRLPGRRDALLVAEGPETGLSVWVATGIETWVAFGSTGRIELPASRRVVACVDDDPRHSPADKATRKAVATWRRQKVDLAVATPWPARREDKSDFNDVLRTDGPLAVQARIEAALTPPAQAMRPTVPIADAREALARAVRDFFTLARGWDPDAGSPPVHGVRVSVGVGKSAAARQEAAALLGELRAAGDRRTVVMAVPTHLLGDEQAGAFNTLPEAQANGLRAAVWRGREAPDPLSPGDRMCRDLEAVRDVQGLGTRVDEAVCRKRDRRTGNEATCRHYQSCGYQQQKRQRADLWIVAHELLFAEKPAALGEPAVVIVDESCWQDGLDGVDAPITLTLDALDPTVTVPNDQTGIDTANLRQVLRRLRELLSSLVPGPLSRKALLDATFTEDNLRVCHRLAWRLVAEVAVVPGMPAAARRRAVAQAQGNRVAMRLARLLEAAADLLASGGRKPAAGSRSPWTRRRMGRCASCGSGGGEPSARDGRCPPSCSMRCSTPCWSGPSGHSSR